MRHALALHLALMRAVLRRMFASKLGGLLNILVIGIALSLPAGMYVLLKNAQGLVEQIAGSPQISLFLTMNAQESDIAELHGRLEANEAIADVEFVARDRALEQLNLLGRRLDRLVDLRLVGADPLVGRRGGAGLFDLGHGQLVEFGQISHWRPR